MLPSSHPHQDDQPTGSNQITERNQTTGGEPAPIANRSRRGRHPRKWLMFGTTALLSLAVLVYLTPWMIANTSLRNSLLAWLLPPEKVTVHSDQATLSWTQPLHVEGLQINLPREDLQVAIDQVDLTHPWWQLIRKSPHFGTVRLVKPTITVGVEEFLESAATRRDRVIPAFTLHASVEDAAIRMHSDNLTLPVLEFANVNAQINVSEIDGHSVLQVGRTEFLDHYALTPQLCNQGLQLLAPIVADVSRIEGSASLEFDSLQVPLSGSDRLTDVRGTLRLHDVTTGLSNPVLQEAIGNMASLFDFDMPESVRIAEDAVVRFAVTNDRVQHESIHFKLPAITGERLWRSSGSVGFDESLNLEIEAPVPIDAISDSAVARLLSTKPMRLHVGGTLSQPDLALPEDAGFLDQLGDLLVGTDQEDDFEMVLNRVEAALETGEAVLPLWDWTSKWLDADN